MQNLDRQLFFDLNHLAGSSPALDALLAAAASLGQYVLVLLLIAAWFWRGDRAERADRQELVLLAVLTVGLALAFNQLIGAVYFRQRPFAVLPNVRLLLPRSTDASFPSDHGTLAAGLTLPFLLGRRRWWLAFAVAGGLMALARVACGTHYPSDLLGSICTAAFAVAFVWSLRPYLEPWLRRLIGVARSIRLA